MSQIRYNRFKNLAGGDTDDFLYENGVRRAVNWNWNGDGWNANAYRVDHPNEWDVGNHAVSRNYCVSPVFLAGVFCSPFLHPPSMRPISSSRPERSAYFSVGTSLLSHAS